MEEWRTIEDYPNYKISNHGKVKTKSGKCREFSIDKHGYKRVDLWKDAKGKTFQVHRLVASAFIYNTEPEKHTIVNHKDTDPSNNHYSNLEWCTQKHNIQHALKDGNKPVGEDCSNSILTEEKVIFICNVLSSGTVNLAKVCKNIKYWKRCFV